ncbi:hypothetical protein SDC9_155605 [bioreactor metagenome]|uniref:Uncharacterized protein n=1 Tax=bioreactor metagenome TaxID=1076179 RepID=A0A645F765_9ZZZZ
MPITISIPKTAEETITHFFLYHGNIVAGLVSIVKFSFVSFTTPTHSFFPSIIARIPAIRSKIAAIIYPKEIEINPPTALAIISLPASAGFAETIAPPTIPNIDNGNAKKPSGETKPSPPRNRANTAPPSPASPPRIPKTIAAIFNETLSHHIFSVISYYP